MNADQLIQELAVKVYQDPLAKARDEADFPNLTNPLHLVMLSGSSRFHRLNRQRCTAVLCNFGLQS